MGNNIKLLILSATLFILGVSSTYAANQVSEIPFSGAPKGSVGLGPGFRFGSSPYKFVDSITTETSDDNADLVPLYLYEGKYIFSYGTTAGVHLLNTPKISIDALFKYRFNRLQPEADPFYRTVNYRRQTVDGGLSAEVKTTLGNLSASWITDTLDRHNGYEMDISYRYLWNAGSFNLSPFLSLIHQSQNLTDYYYGVSDEESRPDLPTYTPDAATFGRIGLNTSYVLSDRFLLFGNLSYENLDDTIKESPLVDESWLYSAFVGFTYNFGSVYSDNAVYPRTDQSLDWSWRVHYGYTAEKSFNQIIRGELKPDKEVNTDVVGITLGKLLADGDKIDFWGRLTLNRRLENNYQDDFWEYIAYVMAMGTGYSPWSDKELFRFGFGFGFSYAENIPIIEQIKQAERGRNSSHFLNYLETQIDVPTELLFGDYGSKNCYVGMTVIHRSGIFASSDILGNVDGGSNVIAGHLECKQ